jgi:RNA polymerase sigma factor (sigma-70 family)
MARSKNSASQQGSPRFPATRHSAILALRSGTEQERRVAMETIATAYWWPVFRYIQLRWHKDDDTTKDLTQGFFLRLIEKDYIGDFDAKKARFRTFLRLCLDRFVMHEADAAGRIRRGGHVDIVPLDIPNIESQIGSSAGVPSADPERLFEEEWIRGLMTQSVEALAEHCRTEDKLLAFELFQRYDLGHMSGRESVTYAQLADDLGTSVETVTNHLAYARREFRRIVLERLREITVTDDEYRHEVMTLLGTGLA